MQRIRYAYNWAEDIPKSCIENEGTIDQGLDPDCRQSFPVDRTAVVWNLIQTKAEPVLGVILDWTATG